MESKSFPSNFDIAGRYAKHREQYDLRYGERGILRKTILSLAAQVCSLCLALKKTIAILNLNEMQR